MSYCSGSLQDLQVQDRRKRWAICELTGSRIIPQACPRRLANPHEITRSLHSRQWGDYPLGPMLGDIAHWCDDCRIDVEARVKAQDELARTCKRLGQVDNPNDVSPYFKPVRGRW